MQPSKLRTLIAAGALLVALLACGPTTATLAPPVAATVAGQSASTAVPKATPLPVATATPPPVATAAPAPSSGWMLFATASDGITVDGLWLASADGTKVSQIVSGQHIVVPNDWDLSKVISPDERDLAIITTTDYNALRNLTLNLVSLPDGAMKVVTPLTSAQTEPTATYLYEDPEL